MIVLIRLSFDIDSFVTAELFLPGVRPLWKD